VLNWLKLRENQYFKTLSRYFDWCVLKSLKWVVTFFKIEKSCVSAASLCALSNLVLAIIIDFCLLSHSWSSRIWVLQIWMELLQIQEFAFLLQDFSVEFLSFLFGESSDSNKLMRIKYTIVRTKQNIFCDSNSSILKCLQVFESKILH
jgi:hypothetical protein